MAVTNSTKTIKLTLAEESKLERIINERLHESREKVKPLVNSHKGFYSSWSGSLKRWR
jgi:hypothetical protein